MDADTHPSRLAELRAAGIMTGTARQIGDHHKVSNGTKTAYQLDPPMVCDSYPDRVADRVIVSALDVDGIGPTTMPFGMDENGMTWYSAFRAHVETTDPVEALRQWGYETTPEEG